MDMNYAKMKSSSHARFGFSGDTQFCTLSQVYKQQKRLRIAADDCRRVVTANEPAACIAAHATLQQQDQTLRQVLAFNHSN